jgi:hypothetical protein
VNANGPWTWQAVSDWSAQDWAPLLEVLDRIRRYTGSYDLAGSDLQRHLAAEDGLVSAARFFHTEQWLILKPAFWQALQIWKQFYSSDYPAELEREDVSVGGTLEGKGFRGRRWHFFVRRVQLDALYPPEDRGDIGAPTPMWQQVVYEILARIPPNERERLRNSRQLRRTVENELRTRQVPFPSDEKKVRKVIRRFL